MKQSPAVIHRELVMVAVLMAAQRYGISPRLTETFAYWGVYRTRNGKWVEHLQPFALAWIREEYTLLANEAKHGR